MLRREDIYQQSHLDGPVIAYVPDDPLHPLKEYDSLADFMKELLGQLRDTPYQEFFSRFVAQKDKGKFFARVKERLTRVVWQQREPLDMGPWWRETAVENPTAEPITNLISGDLWKWLYVDKRNKAIADARVIAVPTGDEDATTRWKRLTSYLDIGWNVFNFVGMLIPGVGEVLLGVMIAQIAEELLEGIEDWSKGDREEAGAHINGVLINFAQLALMGAGHVLPRGAVAAVKPSALIDSLQRVEMPDGKTRLWKPDVGPYAHPVALPANAVPNDIGLIEQGGKQWLRLEEKKLSGEPGPGDRAASAGTSAAPHGLQTSGGAQQGRCLEGRDRAAAGVGSETVGAAHAHHARRILCADVRHDSTRERGRRKPAAPVARRA